MFEFKLPDLGEGVHEGQIVSVLVKEGEPIKEFAPMLEVETDKAAVEIPSPRTGVVSKINVKAGQVVKVGQVMLVIDEGANGGVAAAAPKTQAAPAKAPTPAPSQPAAAAPAPTKPAPVPAPAPAKPATTVSREGPVAAAPVVRKLARELGVDLAQVPPSGEGGRVLREDVERFALQRGGGGGGSHAAPATGGGISIPSEALPDFSQYGPVRRMPAAQIRKTIARQMTRAWLNVPRVTHGDIVDITEMERNRKQLNAGLKDGQPKITMTAIVLKAVASAIREFPNFNCSYDTTTEEIIQKDYVHIGVAVDSPRGLVVPVVRDVDKKPLPQVAGELNSVAERVRTGKFEIAELRGATFTVTNVGALGGTFSTPMVNYPEVAIFGLGKATLQPVVLEDRSIAPRLMMPVSLSFDHRIIDGADAARFTSAVLASLQNPLRLISFA